MARMTAPHSITSAHPPARHAILGVVGGLQRHLSQCSATVVYFRCSRRSSHHTDRRTHRP
eukprot:scaffold29152_cov94-Isochrysis_galbana.AAC.1